MLRISKFLGLLYQEWKLLFLISDITIFFRILHSAELSWECSWKVLLVPVYKLTSKLSVVKLEKTCANILVWAACLRFHGTKCPLLRPFFFLSFFLCPPVTFLPEGVESHIYNKIWGETEFGEPPTPPAQGVFCHIRPRGKYHPIGWQ